MMKISAPPSPASSALSETQARWDESARQQPESFADLLAAMLSGNGTEHGPALSALPLSGLDPENISRAPDFSPRIGTHGEAFEHRGLLIDAALDFQHFAQTIGENKPEDPGEKPGDAEARPPVSEEHETAASLARACAELLAGWFSHVASQPGALHVRPSTGASAAAVPMPGEFASSVSSASAHIPPRAALSAELVAPAEPGDGAGLPTHAARQTSPYGAQLVSFEGGLRLLVRLPRLTESERAQLEAEVAQLFQRFGHHRHEIVINEIAKGEG